MELKNILTDRYKFSTITLYECKRGHVGETYILKTKNQKYFVKIVGSMFSGNMEKALPVLKELHEQGLKSINYPIPTRDDELGVFFGNKFLSIYNFIEGKNDFNYDFEEYSKLIALIHAKTSSVASKPKIEDFSLSFLEHFLSETQILAKGEFLNTYQKKLQKVFIDNQNWFMPKLKNLTALSSNLQKKKIELVITHGDAPGNIIHNDKGELFLIDWDDLLLAPRERDTWFNISNKNQATKFMRHYSKIFPKYKPDKELIDFYILRRFFSDFEEPVSKILSTDTSEKEKEINFNLLVEDCLGWLRPLLDQIPNALYFSSECNTN
jgi:spectinomycin phosphotransferase